MYVSPWEMDSPPCYSFLMGIIIIVPDLTRLVVETSGCPLGPPQQDIRLVPPPIWIVSGQSQLHSLLPETAGEEGPRMQFSKERVCWGLLGKSFIPNQ